MHCGYPPKRPILLILILLLFIAVRGSAASSDTIIGPRSAVLDSIIGNYRIDYCCHTTISKCLAQDKGCAIAKHLKEFGEWLAGMNPEPAKFKEELDKRYAGFVSTTLCAIDTTRQKFMGDPKAPVKIVAYVSSTCNLCKYVVASIYDSIVAGSLKGKARLTAKPFGAGVGDRALCAANALGKFWDLFMAMRKIKTRLDQESILSMADSLGMPRKRFLPLLSDTTLKDMLSESRKEGSRNGVEVTPTFFINGKRYGSYKDARWVVDACLFEYQKMNLKTIR